MHTRLRRASVLGFVAFAALLSGCPNPNTYGTPRTVEPGRFAHTVALESWGFGYRDAQGVSQTGFVPTFPTYQMRIGVAEPVDVGLRLANFSSLGGDVKVNPLKGKFDLAIDPGIQWFRISASSGGSTSSLSVTYLHLPLMLGFNPSQNFSVVLTPGIMYSIIGGSSSSSDGRNAATTQAGTWFRAGLGFDFRISPRFALHPELTALRATNDTRSTIYMFGLGFNFGTLPIFDDIE